MPQNFKQKICCDDLLDETGKPRDLQTNKLVQSSETVTLAAA